MTPDNIRSQRFGRRLLRGLIPEEVSAFLEDVADAYDNTQKWNAVLTARMQIEAEEHVAKATDRAESLIMTAREQEAAIGSEIDRLTQSRLQLVDDIRLALDTYQQWLATVDPRGRARGRREALEMSNGDDESVSASDEARAG